MWFSPPRIIGLVFDTTSVNSGVNRGIAVQLQNKWGVDLLEIACRRRIYEIICGDVGKIVYGDTKSPKNHIFDQIY